jgi:hypothetical protein
MKKLCVKSIIILTLLTFTVLPSINCYAAEVQGVKGGEYLTFLMIGHSENIDLLTFNKDGIFSMALLEEEIDGSGTYTDYEVLFSAKWESTDGKTTYKLLGVSLVSLVIIGTGEKTFTDGDDTDTDDIRFLGIWGSLIPN